MCYARYETLPINVEISHRCMRLLFEGNLTSGKYVSMNSTLRDPAADPSAMPVSVM